MNNIDISSIINLSIYSLLGSLVLHTGGGIHFLSIILADPVKWVCLFYTREYMNEAIANICYIALFIASGLIILKTLSHFKMHIARICFLSLFSILLLYVPFFFGGRLAILISDFLFSDTVYAQIFVKYTLTGLVSSYAYVKFVSILTLIAAIIIAAAAIIVSIVIAFKVVEIVKRYLSRRQITCAGSIKVIFPRLIYIHNDRYIYKRLLHLLN